MSVLKGLVFEVLEQVRIRKRKTATEKKEINSHRCLVGNNVGQCGWEKPSIE